MFDDPQIAQNHANQDLAEATDYRTDATTLRTDATHDLDEASKIEHMGGANAQATELRATAGHLQDTAADFDRRATLLEAAAHLTQGEPKLFGERDDVRERITDAAGRAAAADAHLHETGLNEHDR